MTVMFVGSLPDIAFCLAVQELEIPIPTKILRNAGLGSLGKQTVKIEQTISLSLNDNNRRNFFSISDHLHLFSQLYQKIWFEN
ncbi:hypothetical protein AB1I62_08655 [Enterococcus sp. AN402]|uniref:hypothetical protein n=1 Tax=Enterococcus sp. AN402 TaxID=3151386 RepID=UPI0034574883